MTLASAFLATIALYAGPVSQDPATQTYSNPVIGVSFKHPANWKVEAKKNDTWITIPLKDGVGVAALNLVPAQFRAKTEIWQSSQLEINKQMGLEVVRQWQEEILGVPLLMTKVRSAPGQLSSAIKAVPGLPTDQPLVTLVGLVYSSTARKLLFRMTAPESLFDDAEFQWRDALQSLRTADGKLPTPENPDEKKDPQEPTKPVSNTPTKVVTISGHTAAPGEAPLKRAPNVFEANPARRKVGFYYPEGWKVEATEGGVVSLKHTSTGLTLKLSLNSTLDSDPPLRAMIKSGAQSLRDFETVLSRDEKTAHKNKAGATVARLWRTGKTASGSEIASLDAVGGSIDFYFMLTWRGSGPLDAAVKKLVEELLEQASVEPIG